MDTEQTQVNLIVVKVFDELSIPYFLGGSMASSIHGIYRATADADFVAAIRPNHAGLLAEKLKPAFYADEPVIRHAAEEGRCFNLIHLETMLKVDVFVLRSQPFQLMQMRRRILQPIGPDSQPSLYVASPEDTVLAKLEWYREGGCVSDRQWNDIIGVLKVQADTIDRAYLQEWASELHLNELLSQALKDAGMTME